MRNPFTTTLPRRRRRVRGSSIATAFIVGLLGVAALIGALVGDRERVGAMWISARLTPEGLVVTEVIDYDFGYQSRHGIYRDIPDLSEGAPISVTSASAPDATLITETGAATNVRIGDPDRTVWQRHRYRVDYTLERDALVDGAAFSWNAVGLSWTVGIEEVTVQLALDATAVAPRCERGDPWDSDPCPVTTSDDGLVIVEVDDLAAGDAVTISTTLGTAAPPAILPAAPTGTAPDPGSGLGPPVALALAAGALAAWPGRFLVRRAGREHVWHTGPVDIAFAEPEDGLPTTRMSERELAEFTTIEFEPPRGMSAVEGGLILDERVRNNHLTAWLLEAAIRDEVVLSGGDDSPELRAGSKAAAPGAGPILETMLRGRDSVALGAYDADFTKGWKMLEGTLDDWVDGTDHWDRAGHRRQTTVRVLAAIAGLAGLAAVVVGAAMASRSGTGWLWLTAAGAAVAGGAGAALTNSWELLVRSPTASGLWIRLQSFARFLHESESRHVAEAAERGVLRQYTAWAVALDEADAWAEAVEGAVGADPALRASAGRDLAFVAMGPHLGRAASAAATKPSSSGTGGGGGFGGGGAGGGGGGGGGGSW